MFWKYDDEEKKVVPRKSIDMKDLPSPSEFIEKAKAAGHASFVHGLDEEDQERVFKELEDKEAFELQERRKQIPEEEMLDEAFPIYSSSNETGAEERFEKRKEVFKQEEEPIYKHHVWWLIHNCIAHPLIGIFPCKKTFDFHDWTSIKINGK